MNKIKALVGRISTLLADANPRVVTACVTVAVFLLLGSLGYAQNPGSISITAGGTLTNEAVGYSQGIADFLAWGRNWVYYLAIAALFLTVLIVGVKKLMRR